MQPSFAELDPSERRLDGAWVETADGLAPDVVDQRIFWLVTKRLVKRAMIDGGWDQLFVDPRDGRLWELTFPRGSLFGGGPRRLAVITSVFAREKYGADALVAER
jgi:hypothetical protein